MPFELLVQSVPNQQIVSASYNVQSQEYSMINYYYNKNQPSNMSPSQAASSISPLSSSQSSPSSTSPSPATQGETLQQIPSIRDSFKNNNNKTLQVISANAVSVPEGITQSMTGQVKNTGKDTLRFLTITAQVLDSKYKVIACYC